MIRMIFVALLLSVALLRVSSASAQAPRAQPRVVMLLAQDADDPATAALFTAMRQRFPWATAAPSFQSIPRAQIRAMMDQARRSPEARGVRIPDLTRFYDVTAPSPRDAEALVIWLQGSQSVESAYLAPEPAPPPTAA